MSTGPLVSVVIATNRGGPYLRAAVESVRAQTAGVSEIVLVDDGAPEPLATVAADLSLRYLRQERAGVSAARNAGAAAAIGEWLAFLDDDDVWHPERLAEQLRALAADPAAVASCTGGWYMDAEGTRFGDGWTARPATASDMLSGRVPLPRITTLLVRRSTFLAAGGFDVRLAIGEDHELICRLLMRGEFALVDRELVGYRRHTGNVTHRGQGTRRSNEGQRAARQWIPRLIAVARAEGDERSARALEENWRRFLDVSADENIGEFIAAMRRRRWRDVSGAAWWCLRTTPWRGIRAGVRRITRVRGRG